MSRGIAAKQEKGKSWPFERGNSWDCHKERCEFWDCRKMPTQFRRGRGGTRIPEQTRDYFFVEKNFLLLVADRQEGQFSFPITFFVISSSVSFSTGEFNFFSEKIVFI